LELKKPLTIVISLKAPILILLGRTEFLAEQLGLEHFDWFEQKITKSN